MPSWGELLDTAAPAEHIVQLYGRDDQFLVRNISRYLAEGFRRGDGLVVVATPEHAGNITRYLHEDSIETPRALREGRLVLLDARATLERFMVGGAPDAELFHSYLGEIFDGALAHASTGQVRAFGEMVGLLWGDGEESAAARLEELGNQLLANRPVSLFCAYPIDLFGESPRAGSLQAILTAHTHLCAGPRTLLSSSRISQ